MLSNLSLTLVATLTNSIFRMAMSPGSAHAQPKKAENSSYSNKHSNTKVVELRSTCRLVTQHTSRLRQLHSRSVTTVIVDVET